VVRRQATLLGAGALALLACWLLAPLVPAPSTLNEFRAAAYGGATLFFVMTGGVFLVAASQLGTRSARVLALGTALLLMLVMALNIGGVDVASDAAKLVFAVLLGCLVVRAIERPWWLLPVAVCVPLADAWSVFSSRGVTHAVVDKAVREPRWIDWPTVAIPLPGFDYEAFGRMGVTDFFFLALFIAAAVRWRMGARRFAIALPLSLIASIVIVNERWIDTAIPALPLLCLAFVVLAAPALWRDLRADLAAR
jgi:hypothetical protein